MLRCIAEDPAGTAMCPPAVAHVAVYRGFDGAQHRACLCFACFRVQMCVASDSIMPFCSVSRQHAQEVPHTTVCIVGAASVVQCFQLNIDHVQMPEAGAGGCAGWCVAGQPGRGYVHCVQMLQSLINAPHINEREGSPSHGYRYFPCIPLTVPSFHTY